MMKPRTIVRTRAVALLAMATATATARAESTTCPTSDAAVHAPVRVVAPRYPEMALQARVQGLARIAVELAPSGAVVTTTTCRGIPMLADACGRASSQWRFPAVTDAANRTAVVDCNFIMGDADDPPVTYVPPLQLEIRGFQPILSIVH
jgi:hypothetical protein